MKIAWQKKEISRFLNKRNQVTQVKIALFEENVLPVNEQYPQCMNLFCLVEQCPSLEVYYLQMESS